jgi:hypothetical protein
MGERAGIESPPGAQAVPDRAGQPHAGSRGAAGTGEPGMRGLPVFKRLRRLVTQQRPTVEQPSTGDPAEVSAEDSSADEVPESAVHRARFRAAVSIAVTVLAGLLVWLALVAPNGSGRLTPIAFVRIPIEGLLVVAVLLLLPQRPRRIVAVVVGALLGPLLILKVLDIGFVAALGRPFNPVIDWTYFGSAKGVLSDSIGRRSATIAVIAAMLGLVAVLVCVPLAVLRLTRLVERHRSTSIRVVTALGVVWILCAASGLQFVRGAPLASSTTARLAYEQARQIDTSIRDEQRFAQLATHDSLRNTPASGLLTGLRGKDVLVVFVESYGRVAVQDSAFSPQVDAVLDAGTRGLGAAGFSAKSAFLTSPTFGGISWLAHSTLQSGLWIDNQQRYNDLVGSDRFTLSDAFKRAGWRTVSDVPSDGRDWPQGTSFYHYAKLYNSTNVGYLGPKFSYAHMPDQYTLSTFQRLELAKTHRAPVMAEIDLVSSHTPWAPLPRMVDPSQVGDGSVFDGMPQQGQSPSVVWRHPSQVQAAYGQSIQYSLNAVFSFVENSHDKNLVLVVLGDHQPATIVTGHGASHDVPISIISHDPTVLSRISKWGWQDGMRPSRNAPIWPMDAFRDRFLNAYGPHPPTAPVPSDTSPQH